MSVDWGDTGAMLQGWGTLLGSVAVIYAAKKGADTFGAWKKQKLTERKLEQAERILTATYKAREGLSYIRGIMMWGHELEAAENKLKEDPKQWEQQTDRRKKRLVTAQAYYNRINRTKADQDELFNCLPMARALFGEELEDAVSKLNRQFWLVQVDVDSYIDDNEQDPEFTKKLRRGMYDVNPREGEQNDISNAITDAVQKIEDICLPILRE